MLSSVHHLETQHYYWYTAVKIVVMLTASSSSAPLQVSSGYRPCMFVLPINKVKIWCHSLSKMLKASSNNKWGCAVYCLHSSANGRTIWPTFHLAKAATVKHHSTRDVMTRMRVVCFLNSCVRLRGCDVMTHRPIRNFPSQLHRGWLLCDTCSLTLSR